MALDNGTTATLPRTSEVVIIGGGLVGCSIAYQLAERGVEVTVVERGEIGSGASGRNTGIVASRLTSPTVPGLPDWAARNRELLRQFDREWDGAFAYRETGSLHVLLNEDEVRAATAEVAARRAAGVQVALLSAEECRAWVPLLGPRVLGGIASPLSGQLMPLDLVFAWQRHAAARGARFHPATEVTGLLRDGARVTGVHTSCGAVAARWVVNATNGWAASIAALAGVTLPIAPTRGQILVTEPIAATIEPSLTAGFLEYWRQTPRGQVVMGGGLRVDPVRITTDPTVAIRPARLYSEVICSIMPGLREARALRMWAGIMGFTDDEAPILGEERDAPGLITAAGFTGNGLPWAAAVGEAIACLITGAAPPLPLAPLSSARFVGVAAL